MVITKWTEKIHESQEGEVNREWIYLNQYYNFNGNLKDFAELLEYAFNIQHTHNAPIPSPIFDDYLNKHEVYFYPRDVRDGKPPGYDTIKQWSKGRNTSCDEKHTWDDRRRSKRNEFNRLAEENLAAQFTEDLPYFYECVKKGFEEVDQAVETSKMMDKFNPHQAESATKGRSHAVNSLLQLTGKDKNYTVKADVEAEAKVDATVNADIDVTSDDFMAKELDLMKTLIEDKQND